MAALLSPSRATSQPQQAAVIDWGNPITRGLAIAYVPPCSIYPAPRVVGQAGVGATFTNSLVTLSAAERALVVNGDRSMFAVVSAVADTAYRTVAVAANSATDAARHLAINKTNGNKWRVQSGNGTQSAQVISAASVVDGIGTVAATVDSVGLTGYANGVSFGSVTGVGGLASVSAYTIGGIGTGEYWPGAIYLVLHFNRALSRAEVASLNANPWQIFKSPARRLFFAATEQPSGVLVSANWSEQNESQAASAQVDVRAALAQAEQGEVHQSAVAVQASVAITQAEQGEAHQANAQVQTNAAIAQVEQGDTHAVASAVSVRASAAWVESNDVQQAVIAVGSGAMLSAAWVEQSEAQAVAGQIRVNAAPSWTEQPEGFSLGGLVRVSATAGWIEKSEAHAIIGTVAIPAGAEDIDPYSVPLSRWVVFEGSRRVVVFEGSRRVVRFEGSDNEAGF